MQNQQIFSPKSSCIPPSGILSNLHLCLKLPLCLHDDTHQLKTNQTLFCRHPSKSAQLQLCRCCCPCLEFTKSRHHCQLATSRRHCPIKASQVQFCRLRKFVKSRRHKLRAVQAQSRCPLCPLSVKSRRRPLQVAQIQPCHRHCRHRICLQLTRSRRLLKTVRDQSRCQRLRLRVLLPSQLQNACPCLYALGLFSCSQPRFCCHR